MSSFPPSPVQWDELFVPFTEEEIKYWPEDLRSLALWHMGSTPGPWFSNGYSAVYSGNEELIEREMAIQDAYKNAGYPKEVSASGRKVFAGAWRELLYDNQSFVADTPAAYGDTADGTHAYDHNLIADMYNALPFLLRLIMSLQKELELKSEK